MSQLIPLFCILNEFGVSWSELNLRIPIVLRYVIFRTFSIVSSSLSTLPLPLSHLALPLIVSIISNDKDVEINQINDQVSIENEDKNNERNYVGSNTNKNKNLNEEKDSIITNAVVDTNKIFSPTSTSIQVAKTSILYLLQNMVKMGATKNLIGEKAVKKIAETVNLIVHYPDYTVLKSSNKFLYHEKLLILVNTVLLQNNEKSEFPVIIKDKGRAKNFPSSPSPSESQSKRQGEHMSIIVTEKNPDYINLNENKNGNIVKNERNDTCKIPDEQISVDKIINKTEIGNENENEISCNENWSETVYDLLLQLLNN